MVNKCVVNVYISSDSQAHTVLGKLLKTDIVNINNGAIEKLLTPVYTGSLDQHDKRQDGDPKQREVAPDENGEVVSGTPTAFRERVDRVASILWKQWRGLGVVC